MLHYSVMDYMKVVSRKQDSYIKTEKAWKPVHLERLKQNIISGWYLYKVHYAYEGDRHNYTTINTYKTFESLEKPYPRDMIAAEDKENGYDGFEDLTESTRKKVHSELSKLVDACGLENTGIKPSRFLKVAFIKVDEKDKDIYKTCEINTWKGAHQYLVDQGIQDWWALYELEFPHGMNVGYQFITISAVNSFEKLNQLDYWSAYKSANPQGDFQKDIEKTLSIRRCERAELWELIDYLNEEVI